MMNSPVALKIRHIGYTVLPWCWLVMIAVMWIAPKDHPGWHDVTAAQWVIRAANGVFLAVYMLSLVGGLWHKRELCGHCVGSVPLNGEAAAGRRWVFLGVQHLAARPWFVLVLVSCNAVVIAADFGLNQDGLLNKAVQSGFDGLLFTITYAHSSHNRLMPWCPWCRDNGGGDPESVPAPEGDLSRS